MKMHDAMEIMIRNLTGVVSSDPAEIDGSEGKIGWRMASKQSELIAHVHRRFRNSPTAGVQLHVLSNSIRMIICRDVTIFDCPAFRIA